MLSTVAVLALALGGLEVQPTPRLVEEGGRLLQVVKLGGVTGELEVTATLKGEQVQARVALPGELRIPALGAGEEATLTLTAGQETITRPWVGPRRWTLFLVPYSHLDIGYTNSQRVVREIHLANLAGKVDARGKAVGALELMDQTDDWPDQSRFKFTSEGAWPVLELLDDPAVPQAKKDALLRRIAEGRLEVGAFLIDATHKFMGEEGLMRDATAGALRLKQHGLTVRSAMLNDVGDASAAVPVLAAAGVRYLMFGPNSLHLAVPPLQYLEAGGGKKVLVWVPPGNATYGENTDLGLRPLPPKEPTLPHDPFAPLPDYTPLLDEQLTWLEEKGLPLPGPERRFDYRGKRISYPYDSYLVPCYPARAGDNGHQDLTPSEIARAWSQTWAWPKLEVATLGQFFEDVERRYGDQIPVHRGDFAGFWGEQVFFSILQLDPKKEARQREAEALLGAAEGFGAAAAAWAGVSSPPPRDGVLRAFVQQTLNNDHNPIPVSISGNRCPSTSSGRCYPPAEVSEWRETRQSWSRESHAFATAEAGRVAGELAQGVRRGPGAHVVVLNPVSWERSEVVEVDGLAPPASLVDPRDGAALPVQFVGEKALFIAPRLPAWGYVAFRVERRAAAGRALAADEKRLESEDYRVGLPSAPRRPGALSQLLEKKSGTDYADYSGRYGLNQWVLAFRSESVGNGLGLGLNAPLLEVSGFSETRVREAEAGPVLARATVEGTVNPRAQVPSLLQGLGAYVEQLAGEAAPIPTAIDVTLEQEIRLYAGVPRVELIQRFGGLTPQAVESAFAFPLNGEARAQLNVPFGVLRVGGADPLDFFSLTEAQQGDELLALPMRPGGADVYSGPFSWIQGIPADNVARDWTALDGAARSLTLSCRQSGAVLAGSLSPAPFPQVRSDPALFAVAVGPTALGQTLLGTPSGESHTLHCALATGLETREERERFGRGFTRPPLAAVVEGERESGLAPWGSFFSVSRGALATWVKPSEEGGGVAARVLGLAGGRVEVRVPLAKRNTRLALADALERPSCLVGERDGVHAFALEGGDLAHVVTTQDVTLPACAEPPAAACGCQAGPVGLGAAAGLALLRALARRRRSSQLCRRWR